MFETPRQAGYPLGAVEAVILHYAPKRSVPSFPPPPIRGGGGNEGYG
jgi:hypothetical protein